MKTVADICDANILNSNLDAIYHWATVNNLQFNDTKFELLQYGTNEEMKTLYNYKSSSGSVIEKSSSVSDLGITMCDDATFKSHIDEICISVRKVVSWVCRTFKSRSVSTRGGSG